MARPIQRNAFRAGKDEADAAPGYASSGESAFTRDAARGEGGARFGSRALYARGPGHGKEELIGITRTQIRKIEIDMGLADTRAGRDLFAKMIEIKKKFIATLSADIVRGER